MKIFKSLGIKNARSLWQSLFATPKVWDVYPRVHIFDNSFESQSSPSYRPWPCTAQVAWMYHWKQMHIIYIYCHYTVIIFTHPSISQILQSELVREFRGRHCVGQVLLISENQQGRVPQLVLLQLRKDVDWNMIYKVCQPFSGALPVPRQSSPCHCCPLRKWVPGCSGSSVSTEVWSCPDRPHPRLWSRCSCTPRSRR